MGLVGKLKGWVLRVGVAVVSMYLVLVVIEIIIVSQARFDAQKQTLSVRGMLKADPDFGFTTVPHSTVVFDDGVQKIPMSVNGLGQRDDEPDDPNNIDDDLLLLGDSFAFGLGLAREDTIGSAFERHSEGEVTVYNAGVPGWGAPHARLQLERLPFTGTHVAYLYYVNDGRFDNVEATSITVRQQIMVPRRTADGREFTDAQLDARIAEMLRDKSMGEVAWKWLGAVTTLARVRAIWTSLRDEQLRLTGIPQRHLPDDLRARLVDDVVAMRERAGDRHFFVVITPARGEAVSDTWSPSTAAVVEGLRAEGIEVHEELLTRLDNDAYLPHDGHFGPHGASEAAKLLLEIVRG